jgi:hypothetical protein
MFPPITRGQFMVLNPGAAEYVGPYQATPKGKGTPAQPEPGYVMSDALKERYHNLMANEPKKSKEPYEPPKPKKPHAASFEGPIPNPDKPISARNLLKEIEDSDNLRDRWYLGEIDPVAERTPEQKKYDQLWHAAADTGKIKTVNGIKDYKAKLDEQYDDKKDTGKVDKSVSVPDFRSMMKSARTNGAGRTDSIADAIHQMRYGESFQKSIANQETADYLQLKYRPYTTVHGKNPHQPSIETAIDALQSQQKERDRINDEWFGNSLAGDKMGKREAEALAEQMRQQGKSDEEIREALSGLSDKYIPDDYNPDNFDEPWARWSAFENFAGIVNHPDSPGYVVGKFDDPKADPVVSAVRNNVRQQMGLNDTKENVGALASAGVNFYTNTNYPSKKEDSKPTEKSAFDPLLDAIHQMRYGESFRKTLEDWNDEGPTEDEEQQVQSDEAKAKATESARNAAAAQTEAMFDGMRRQYGCQSGE